MEADGSSAAESISTSLSGPQGPHLDKMGDYVFTEQRYVPNKKYTPNDLVCTELVKYANCDIKFQG